MDGVQIIEPVRARKDRRFKDMTGREFGYWTVIGYAGSRGGATWACRCKCGTEKVLLGDTLRRGASESCGCKPFTRTPTVTHGMTYSSEYEIWCGMKKRCLNPRCKSYRNYGGRGITICERWLESFDNFYEDMGNRPSDRHTLDRENNDGAYCPENCRWATKKVQANNRRSNALLTALGATLSLSQWQEKTGIGWSTIKDRVKRGWHPDVAVTTPAWGAKRGVNCGCPSITDDARAECAAEAKTEG